MQACTPSKAWRRTPITASKQRAASCWYCTRSVGKCTRSVGKCSKHPTAPKALAYQRKVKRQGGEGSHRHDGCLANDGLAIRKSCFTPLAQVLGNQYQHTKAIRPQWPQHTLIMVIKLSRTTAILGKSLAVVAGGPIPSASSSSSGLALSTKTGSVSATTASTTTVIAAKLRARTLLVRSVDRLMGKALG
jgi:hypothetical protein